MQKQGKLLCKKGHVFDKICVQPQCLQHFAVCQKTVCSFNHSFCLRIVPLKGIEMKLMKLKDAERQKWVKVIEVYEIIEKMIEVDKKQLKNKIDEEDNKWKHGMKEQKDLQKVDQIENLCFEIKDFVRNSLKFQKQKREINDLDKYCQHAVQNLKENLVEVKTFWNGVKSSNKKNQKETIFEMNKNISSTPRTIDYKFHSDLCKKSMQVFNNGKSIKVTKRNMLEIVQTGYFSQYALTSPSIDNLTEIQTIRFKIIRSQSSYVGIANINALKANLFRFPADSSGLYMVCGCSGDYIHASTQQKQFTSDFIYEKNDTIQIQYNPSTFELHFLNLRTSSTLCLKNIKPVPGNPLHFCIELVSQNDEITIVD